MKIIDAIAIRIFMNRNAILPFDMEAARIWGRLAAKLGHSGSDMMIAAIALSRDATVVTRNVRDFQPTGCRVENPF